MWFMWYIVWWYTPELDNTACIQAMKIKQCIDSITIFVNRYRTFLLSVRKRNCCGHLFFFVISDAIFVVDFWQSACRLRRFKMKLLHFWFESFFVALTFVLLTCIYVILVWLFKNVKVTSIFLQTICSPPFEFLLHFLRPSKMHQKFFHLPTHAC